MADSRHATESLQNRAYIGDTNGVAVTRETSVSDCRERRTYHTQRQIRSETPPYYTPPYIVYKRRRLCTLIVPIRPVACLLHCISGCVVGKLSYIRHNILNFPVSINVILSVQTTLIGLCATSWLVSPRLTSVAPSACL